MMILKGHSGLCIFGSAYALSSPSLQYKCLYLPLSIHPRLFRLVNISLKDFVSFKCKKSNCLFITFYLSISCIHYFHYTGYYYYFINIIINIINNINNINNINIINIIIKKFSMPHCEILQ